MMKTVLVYFSLTGHTRWAAKRLAALTGADLVRIEPVKPYPKKGLARFFHGGRSAVMKEAPALKPYAFDAASCGRVLFCFPVWAGHAAPPVRSFILDQKEALAGKTFAALACQSGSGAERAFRELETLLGSPLSRTLVLIDPGDRPSPENEKKLQTFAEDLKQL